MADNPLPVFVTGASRGIGAATAREFARAGHPVALVARSAAGLAATAKEIESEGGRAVSNPCDVADAASVKRAVEHAAASVGGIGIVGNAAGTLAPVGPLVDTPPADWARAIAGQPFRPRARHALRGAIAAARRRRDQHHLGRGASADLWLDNLLRR